MKSVEEALSAGEEMTLSQCEKRIAKGLHTFFEVGQALCIIQEQHLYRREFKSFKDYCRFRWGMGRQYAYRMIEGAKVVSVLASKKQGTPLPEHEAQIRPLLKLSPEEKVKAWEIAQSLAGNQPLTTKHVETAAQKIAPEQALTVHGYQYIGSATPMVYESSALKECLQLSKALKRGDPNAAKTHFEKLHILIDRILGLTKNGDQ